MDNAIIRQFETRLPRITFDEAFLGFIFAALCIFFAVTKGTLITHISAGAYGMLFAGACWYYFNALHVCNVDVAADVVTVTWKNRRGKTKYEACPATDLLYKHGHTGVKGALLTFDLVKKEKNRFFRRPRFMRMVLKFGWKFDDLQALRVACDAAGIKHTPARY